MEKLTPFARYLLISFFITVNVAFIYSSILMVTASHKYIDKIPDKTFGRVTSIECIHKCKLGGFAYSNFHHAENVIEGVCNCFYFCSTEDFKDSNDWELTQIQQQSQPLAVAKEDVIIDGAFTEWSEWSVCSVTCGGGTQIHTRTCTNPTPSKHGLPCEGVTEESRICNTQNCPVDGKFTEWKYSKCDTSGKCQMTRSCTNPAPQYGGAECVGQNYVSLSCYEDKCPVCRFIAGDGDYGGAGILESNPQNSPENCIEACQQYKFETYSYDKTNFLALNGVSVSKTSKGTYLCKCLAHLKSISPAGKDYPVTCLIDYI